jgi:hypothetical protein
MSFAPRVAAVRIVPALVVMLAAGACAPAPTPPSPGQVATGLAPGQVAPVPVLLSCPAGQQPWLRQILVGQSLVPQVECVSVPAPAHVPAVGGAAPTPVLAPPGSQALAAAQAPAVEAPVPMALAPVSQAGPPPVRSAARRPAARRVVYDDIEQVERPTRRSWQKSALIIGSAAGAGAGVGAAAGGKKGALIGAAVGGGAATIWDQVTRRQPR